MPADPSNPWAPADGSFLLLAVSLLAELRRRGLFVVVVFVRRGRYFGNILLILVFCLSQFTDLVLLSLTHPSPLRRAVSFSFNLA